MRIGEVLNRWGVSLTVTVMITAQALTTAVAFIDEYRQVFGAEPICRVPTDHGLKIATSTYYAARNRELSAQSGSCRPRRACRSRRDR
ncbi:hypothetical protein M2271_007737 [Streptomyces sp. LBL]|uniref:hypothetical protein n=1 Tax=Streptomyces sp. LBL TaxID=2940562 RepID=UPI0024746AE0|nr:hypothetical protein [Streptomyces sp. LBL]MDH6629888.1 hypothetical protein [Streptomyces sp. LBL]